MKAMVTINEQNDYQRLYELLRSVDKVLVHDNLERRSYIASFRDLITGVDDILGIHDYEAPSPNLLEDMKDIYEI